MHMKEEFSENYITDAGTACRENGSWNVFHWADWGTEHIENN